MVFKHLTGKVTGPIFAVLGAVTGVAAQSAHVGTARELAEAADSNSVMYWGLFIVILAAGGAFFLWRRSRATASEESKDLDKFRDYNKHETFDLEFDEELEWLRKAKKKSTAPKASAARTEARRPKKSAEDVDLDTKAFQEKMRMLQYAQLPINSFHELSPAKTYEPLPVSSDRALLTAIEQANEEFEEDEAVRELAVRILAAFRTQNSVDALSQMALYDLSSSLRSKSVAILADFDHESVFEAILLACADPTREVRAAAARGLFRLNFDRSDAWKRLIESRDEYRMSHAVRAAVEADIVQKSFDRLVHQDLKIAYEAFTLVALMIRAGETKEIFDTILEHKDERVKFALLHVLKVVGDDKTRAVLLEMIARNEFSTDLLTRVNDVVQNYSRVTA
jgi:hypothetical protein